MSENMDNEKLKEYTQELMRMYHQQRQGMPLQQVNNSQLGAAAENSGMTPTNLTEPPSQQGVNRLQRQTLSDDSEPAPNMQGDPPWISDLPPNLNQDGSNSFSNGLVNEIDSEMNNGMNSEMSNRMNNVMNEQAANEQPENVYSPRWKEFEQNNVDNGFIKVEAFSGKRTFPIEGAEVLVSKTIEDETHLFHRTFTDESGMTSALPVPAPVRNNSLKPGGERPYQTYTLEARKPGYRTVIRENLPVFPNVVSLQPVQFQPVPVSDVPPKPDIKIEPGTDL